jgi:hypothetical protein
MSIKEPVDYILNFNYFDESNSKNIEAYYKHIEYDDFTNDLQKFFTQTDLINKYHIKLVHNNNDLQKLFTQTDLINKYLIKLVHNNNDMIKLNIDMITLNNHNTNGIYTLKVRKEKIARYKAKIFRYKAKIADGSYNKINYEVRKKFADARTRIGGRFVKK